MHPQPVAVPEGMAVRLLDRRTGGGTDMREDAAGLGVRGQFMQVAVVPGRLRTVEQAWLGQGSVPTDAEAVPVGGLGTHPGMLALNDERVGGSVEQIFQIHR